MKQKKVALKKTNIIVEPVKFSFDRLNLFLLAALVVVITFISFSPSLKNNFINWDDNAYVFENANLSKPLPDAIKYFVEPHYFIGNYIPLTMVIYTLEYRTAHLKPGFYHKINLLLHLMNVLLVFWFIYLLSGRKPWVAALVSLFFGIHPMHVESVAWVAELKDVLYSFFFLGGLIAYFKYLQKKKQIPDSNSFTGLLPVIILYIFSVVSKPAAVSFPLVLILIDYYTKRKFDKKVWIEKMPFFIISLFFGIVAVKTQQADQLLHDYYPLGQRFFFAAHSLLNYIVKVFLPVDLSIFYPYPVIEDGHLPYFYYFTPVIVAALFFGVFRSIRSSRLLVFGFMFFFVNIVLVLQLLSFGDAIIADRYTYIPYIGLFFVLAMTLQKLYDKNVEGRVFEKTAITGTIIVLVVLSSYFTRSRCKIWHDSDSIATDLLNKFPDDRIALNNKGYLLFEQGKYQEAVKLFDKAVQIKPDYVMPYINLIDSYLAMNQKDSAWKTLDTALKHSPKDYHLLNIKGNLLYRDKKFPEALKCYNNALRSKKNNIRSYIFITECYFTMKDYKNALKTADVALGYEPSNYILLNNKGYVLFVMGKYTEAVTYFNASLKMKPDYSTASVNLANCTKAMTDSLSTKNSRL